MIPFSFDEIKNHKLLAEYYCDETILTENSNREIESKTKVEIPAKKSILQAINEFKLNKLKKSKG